MLIWGVEEQRPHVAAKVLWNAVKVENFCLHNKVNECHKLPWVSNSVSGNLILHSKTHSGAVPCGFHLYIFCTDSSCCCVQVFTSCMHICDGYIFRWNNDMFWGFLKWDLVSMWIWASHEITWRDGYHSVCRVIDWELVFMKKICVEKKKCGRTNFHENQLRAGWTLLACKEIIIFFTILLI